MKFRVTVVRPVSFEYTPSSEIIDEDQMREEILVRADEIYRSSSMKSIIHEMGYVEEEGEPEEQRKDRRMLAERLLG